MGVIILIAVGCTIGWLASIVLRRETNAEIVANLAVGTAGSVLAGGMVSHIALMSGLSATSLLVGILGAVVLLGLTNVILVKLAH